MKPLYAILALAFLMTVGCSAENPMEANTTSTRLAGIDTPLAAPSVPFGAWLETTFDPTPVPPGTPFEILGTGVATHMGRCDLFILSVVEIIGGIPVQFGDWTITAANGDELTLESSGGAGPPDAQGMVPIFGDWTITGGTGRFSGVGGIGTYEGLLNFVAATGQFSMNGALIK